MNNLFSENSPFSYKLIYAFVVQDDAHEGLVKVGDATIKCKPDELDKLVPNCKALNTAAHNRIKDYSQTMGTRYTLLHTELAVRYNGAVLEGFRDYDVSKVLTNSKVMKVKPNGVNATEWFKTDINTVIAAIKAVKEYKNNLSGEKIEEKIHIIFRPEQEQAIKETKKIFAKSNKMLWNAKMRFGKTLCALQVAKEMDFPKTIILTHRPVVDDGWYNDFNKIFTEGDTLYGSKFSGNTFEFLKNSNQKFIYFASIQDLRSSAEVGGNYEKNSDVFAEDWDFVIVDEAHEGTKTELGDNVISKIVKENSKFLALSGTPFNIFNEYEEKQIFTWDYIMEQEAKQKWDSDMDNGSNPYDDLPIMHILTYTLSEKLSDYAALSDKAFNFREFFRVEKGKFVHENDINSFLNLITKDDEISRYPYSNEEYRNMFRHTLWMIPGVKEGKALEELLKRHSVFGCGKFRIVNVAGNEKNEDEESSEALTKVRQAIKKADEEDGYTITLSCGKLTTGVTVKEWTAVLMLAGSFSTSASQYLQTIFRVQSPCNINGMSKRHCYVFDFAPDRALKMMSEAVNISTKAGKANVSDRDMMNKLLNYCPVISIDGTFMKTFDANALLRQLKRAYAERAINSGFEDTNLYNDTLLKLSNMEIEKFKDLGKIIKKGATKSSSSKNGTPINQEHFDNEEYETTDSTNTNPNPNPEPIDEDTLRLKEEQEKAKKERTNAIKVLREISIRLPLLLFAATTTAGTDMGVDEVIHIKDMVNYVDDASWTEFMPKGVTKKLFLDFVKYYDEEIIEEAGRGIRIRTMEADFLPPLERIKEITQMFAKFRNPDKETVLTPWRVVNMHLGDCIGGYNFYDKTYTDILEEPRYIDIEDITKNVFSENAKILEINSKTGLYPLYATYSLFKKKCDKLGYELTLEEQNAIWKEIIEKNVFIICNTPMAKYITKRTLCGYKDIKLNAHYFEHLVQKMENRRDAVIDRISNPQYWKKEHNNMDFNAIIGNPPYQMSDGGAQSSAKPIYNLFIDSAKEINPQFISMIVPSRWMTGGKGLDDFRDRMIHDKHIKILHDYADCSECFSNVDIKGGVCYFLWDRDHDEKCDTYRHDTQGIAYAQRYLVEGQDNIYIRDPRLLSIKQKVCSFNEIPVSSIVSSAKHYGFRAEAMRNAKKFGLPEFSDIEIKDGYRILGLGEKNKRIWKYLPNDYPIPNTIGLDKYKVFISEAYGCGEIGECPSTPVLGTPVLGTPGELCTETFLQIGPFDSKNEAENFLSYLKTKFFRALVGIKKQTQHTTQKVYTFVPMQDFSRPWTDKELFDKYGLTQDERDFIEQNIVEMDLNHNFYRMALKTENKTKLEATLEEIDEKFILKAGSQIAPIEERDSDKNSIFNECKVEDNVLMEDYECDSLSQAAMIVRGKQMNGKTYWKKYKNKK